MIGIKIYHKTTCRSSFEWARQNLHEPDGTVFLADHIENARGRGNRLWQSSRGQALITILLKPDRKNFNHLSMALSLGFLMPLKKYGVSLKWPNDFILSGKKLGGMLIESIWQSGELQGVIVGVGINVNNKIDVDGAISLGTNVNLDELIRELLHSANKFYEKFLVGEDLYEQWKREQFYLGKEITVHKRDGELLSGMASDINRDGSILIEQVLVSYPVVEDVNLL